MEAASVLAGATLHYFPLPGRGECVRLALVLSGQSWQDHRIVPKEWGEFKPSTPWGSMPTLELSDGTHLGQARSLMRFIGKATGLYPTDALAACRVDELMDAVDDLLQITNKVGQGKEQSEKEAERSKEAESGVVANAFERIDRYIGLHGSEGHCVGSSLTVADLMVATLPPFVVSGFFDGVPPETIERYPSVQAVRKTVMALPAVVAHYEARGEAMSPVEKFLLKI